MLELGMKYRKYGAILLLSLLLLAVFASGSDKERRAKAMSVLNQARKAHLAGRHEEAQSLLLKARFIWKAMPQPDWARSTYNVVPGTINKTFAKDHEADRVGSLLQEARQAYTRWDTHRARALLIQARLLNPQLPDPDWINDPPGPRESASKQLNRGQLIAQLRANPGETSLVALENYLEVNPDDDEARKILMQAAISAGDVDVLQRLQGSFSDQNKEGQLFPVWLKGLGLLLLLATLIWQTYGLWVDFRSH